MLQTFMRQFSSAASIVDHGIVRRIDKITTEGSFVADKHQE